MQISTLTEAAYQVLSTAAPDAKVAKTFAFAQAWMAGTLEGIGTCAPPDRPSRPGNPELRTPKDMPKRRAGGTEAHRAALLHAVAHIELNAIDLAWDMVARFAPEGLPTQFFDDWVSVAHDEARHFSLVSKRLADMGCSYGDLPAHDGLWEAAVETRLDLRARLAVVPMVLEARGLDVTPAMIDRLEKAGDTRSAGILRIIYEEEIGHVAAGERWFRYLCEKAGDNPVSTWQSLVRTYFHGAIKPPFNKEAREKAGLDGDFYEPLAAMA